MKVLMINSVCGIGSTGRICTDIAERLEAAGHDCRIACGRGAIPERYKKYAMRVGNDLSTYMHGAQARVFDNAGFGSRGATRKLIKQIEEYDPDVIHLHNLHGYYLDVETLFAYLKKAKKPVAWTLHDCWAFTGHCPHFSAAGCEKWKTQCYACTEKRHYPASLLLDRSRANYLRKKTLFSCVDDLTIVTPSNWLATQVRQSFLGDYPTEVIYNGIDGTVFCDTPSELRKRYGLENRKIALGVANIWDERKGLPYMLRLAKLLGDDWVVVLLGLSAKQIAALPSNIIGITRTRDISELAAWYSVADVYVNTSAEETMGMTTAEAISCGTPVAAFHTTATPEVVGENGMTVRYGDVNELANATIQIATLGKEHFRTNCDRFALEGQCEKYLKLYQKLEGR